MVKRVILEPEKTPGIKVESILNRGIVIISRLTDEVTGESWVQKKVLDLPDNHALFGGLYHDKEARKRLRREFEVMKKLSGCPNIAEVYDHQFLDAPGEKGISILAMEELFSSPNGSVPIQGKPFFKYVVGVCNSLDSMKAKGIVNRDVKPKNVLYNLNQDPKLFDFDWCKDYLDISSFFRSASGAPTGTKWYRSPEQQRMEDLDYKTDTYSAALTMYEITTGRIASSVMFMEDFEEDVERCNERHVNKLRPRLVEIYSEDYADIFLRALNPEREKRDIDSLKKISLEMLARG